MVLIFQLGMTALAMKETNLIKAGDTSTQATTLTLPLNTAL